LPGDGLVAYLHSSATSDTVVNIARTLRAVAAVAALQGCTSIGAWVYEDPSFKLHAVAFRQDSLDLTYIGCNRNDYDVLGEGLRFRIDLAGTTIAQGIREQPVFLATRDSSEFTVTLPLRDTGIVNPGKGLPYDLEGEGTLRTPGGPRTLVFHLHGRVAQRGSELAWSDAGLACHPGLSALPPVFDRRINPGDRSPPPPEPLGGGSPGGSPPP
jgi:hypothetical protein